MCGIVGVATKGSAYPEIRNMLAYLQHRGPQAAGALTVGEDGKSRLQKNAGSVREALPAELEALVGPFGIGHTRYTTSGSNGKANAKPLYDDRTEIGIADNGHVMNLSQLEQALAAVGSPKQLDTDTEQLLQIFSWHYAEARQKGQDPLQATYFAAGRTMDVVMGAFAIVATIPELGVIAFKSPNGTRPLMYGRKREGIAVASESMPLDFNGYGDITDVLPGEVVVVDRQLEVQQQQVRLARQQSCAFEWVYFAKGPSKIQGIRVNEVRRQLGELLAERYEALWRYIDVVIPVPETAKPIAAAFAAKAGIPFDLSLEKIPAVVGASVNIPRIFLAEDQRMREDLAGKVFFFYEEQIRGRSLGLFDDSIVRGTNSRAIVEKARRYGAREVHFFSAWPPFRFPCRMGIDTPTSEELAAHEQTIEQIRQQIGADSLNYAQIEDVIRAIGSERLCLACVDGRYPSEFKASAPILLPFSQAES